MATFKALLDKRRQLKDGTYPLVVRVFNDRKYKDISLKTYLKESQFDEVTQKVKRNHPNEKVINQIIKQTVLKVESTKLNLELHEQEVSVERITSQIVNPKRKISFYEFGNSKVAELQVANRVGNAIAYRDALSALKTYTGKCELQFVQVNYELLCAMETAMLSKGLKRNTIAAYNRSLRAIFNKGINEEVVESKYYPYRKYKIKGERTAKRNIAKENIQTMLNCTLQSASAMWHARNYFMLSFNLRGASMADIACIKPCDIANGRLIYKRKKTHKLYSVKLTAKAQEILSYYIKPDSVYILPIIDNAVAGNLAKERAIVQQAIKVCNKHLKQLAHDLEIQFNITTYVARHSWATIAKKIGYSKDLISEALGHSYGNRITEIYLDSFDQEVIDEMNEQVCRF